MATVTTTTTVKSSTVTASTKLSASFRPVTAIDKVTDAGSFRFALANIVATPGENGRAWLTATNGRILAATHAAGQVNKACYVPAKAIPRPKSGDNTVELCDEGWKVTSGKKKRKVELHDTVPVERRFPNAPDVCKKINCDDYTAVTINADLLKILADAIRNESRFVTLFIPNPDKDRSTGDAIPVVSDAGIGVLMPAEATRAEVKASEYNQMLGEWSEHWDTPSMAQLR